MAVKILLKDVRASRGISQDGLARLIEQSRTNIQSMESGRAKSLTFATLDKLCEVLTCQPGDLLRYESDSTGG